MRISIDRRKTFQTFTGFGASGAWWAQCVGGWDHTDPESGLPVRERIAMLLYDKDAGIGLTAYRFNVGGGSKDSGKGDIGNPLRRTECFALPGGGYDFSRDANAVAMLRLAVQYGAEEVILFVNSPPEHLTRNGMTHCSKNRPFLDNLPKENYLPFARFCLDTAEHFLAQGVPVKYISPINEPFWVWNGGQEGCHYTPRSAGALMEVIAREMERRPALKNVMLSGVENGDIRWFNKSYTRQLLRRDAVRRRMDGIDLHSYFLNPFHPVKLPVFNNRAGFLRRYRAWLDRIYPGTAVKMSEWCHMQGGRDRGMDSALVMANVIYEDLTILNVTAWQHWIAVSEMDYCDGLIYIDLAAKTFEMTKRYYATGNFSKYIPRGAKRVAVTCPTPEIKALAFVKGDKTVLILINDTKETKPVTLPAAKGTLAVTDDAENLKEHEIITADVTLTPRSVNTFVYDQAEA